MKKAILTFIAGAGVLILGACEQQRAFGDANSVVVAATPEIWTAIEDSVQSIMEPTIQTVRRERTFNLTHQDPTAEAWSRLQLFMQELAIGTADDPWIAAALDAYEGDETPTAPGIYQSRNVWARNQLVTIVLLPPDGGPEDVLAMLPDLHELMDDQYREYVVNRMFTSEPNTALADSLMENAGFTITVPSVYERIFQDSVFVLRNDNPDPSELIRQVGITWRSPIPGEPPTLEGILDWRREIADVYYPYPQVNDTSQMTIQRGQYREMPVTEVQAIWSNPPEDTYPAGGPFTARVIDCPADDRRYLLDAWLYAPGQDKYAYMIQLETILGSFACS